ncbi:MAG TPA: glycosyltransferase, partial [Burkholderiales bacterium]|nr:glycosyltransferase [Burkholderiales bacterium]
VNAYALLYATLALFGSRVRAPLAVTWHTTLVQGVKERLKMLYYRPFFWNADCLVFVCDAQRRYWLARGVSARSNKVIHNGVDARHWAPFSLEERRRLRGALGFADGDYVIGISAVMRPEKNHLELVKALALLRRRGIGARALMIGDGPMRAAVEERARRLGIAASVTITGLQQHVRPFLGACDAVALTSRTEALSLAAIEAMSLGKPVVHSDVGGAAEMILPGHNGFLYPPGDTAALVERLSLLAQPAARERMGEQARRTVEGQFTEVAMVDRYEQLLLDLEMERIRHANVRRTARAH